MPTAQLIVDLDAVRSNYEVYRRRHGGVAGVLKGNAYGLGMERIATTLYAAGCRDFFVASVDEGESLREVLSDARIVVLSGPIVADDVVRMRTARLVPVINNVEQVDLFGDERPAVVVHIDTGMNRLGFRRASDAATCVDGFPVDMVISHYACADDVDHPMNEAQTERFALDRQLFAGVPWSLGNSAAALSEREVGMVRIGLGLTGASPFLHERRVLKPVARLEVSVAGVYPLGRGETVGYGASYTATDDERIAVLTIGYADGVPRSLSNKGAFYSGRARLPIRGRISMDLTVVGLDDRANLTVGDRVEWFGGSQSLEHVAADAGTLNYEILTGIGQRVARRYLGG